MSNRPVYILVRSSTAAASVPTETASSLSTGTACIPSRRSLLFSKVNRWLIAAGQRLTAFQASFARWRVDHLGTIEFTESVHRRGFAGLMNRCTVCHADVHDFGEMCPVQKIADCAACGHSVILDYYLNHYEGRRPTHVISNVRPATETEWRSLLRIARRRRHAASRFARALNAQREAV
jgi:hypothetical protein